MARQSRLKSGIARRAIAAAIGTVCTAFVGFVDPASAWADPAPNTKPAEVADLALSIQRATLDNGLRVVLNVDHGSPSIAVSVTYDVGSRNEEVGRSGFAHLFEHMMFQGSGHVAKGEHFKLITARGGTLNGTTSTDRTNFFESLPSSELPLSLWLEADRMKSLAVTSDNVENQRAVVEEEYRMRVSNQAYAEGLVRLRALAFQGYFPYEHDTIGSMADLDAAKFEYVAAFHDAYYAPNNAVLSVAGDFDADEAMRLISDYFGTAKKQPAVPPYTPPAVPPDQTEPRHADVQDSNARTPAILQAWEIPGARTPEHYALELGALVLGQGESSRLFEKLVREDGKAQSVGMWTSDQRGPDLLALRAVLSEGAKLPEVQHTLESEINRLGATGPTAAELEKAKAHFASDFVFGLETDLSRATQLGEFELYWGDARLLARELSHYRAVTATDVRDAVKKYLTKARRSTVHVLPKGPEADKIMNAKNQEHPACGGP